MQATPAPASATTPSDLSPKTSFKPLELGTACTPSATKVLLLGSGELGKEVAIALQRLGCEVWACDHYPSAPAMQVAHFQRVLDMRDPQALRELLEDVQPDFVVPEIEAIATEVLLEWEARGNTVVPTARAAHLTMNREGIRTLAAEELGLPTSPYDFASSYEELCAGAAQVGFPCVVKPVMSSSGKGQSLVRSAGELQAAWQAALQGGRGQQSRVIVEGWIAFDEEITLLTVSHTDGIFCCEPIGHRQEDGDYRESWQPHAMSGVALQKAQDMAQKVVQALGGRGIFGVELFIQGENVWFSEVSPRPHDTGMVTLISQDRNQFELHVRAFLGLPTYAPKVWMPSASAALLLEGNSQKPTYALKGVLASPDLDLRLFGKPEIAGKRRMGVVLSRGASVPEALATAILARDRVQLGC
jgi:phosphoribosylglycinamide formyltransferase 2